MFSENTVKLYFLPLDYIEIVIIEPAELPFFQASKWVMTLSPRFVIAVFGEKALNFNIASQDHLLHFVIQKK